MGISTNQGGHSKLKVFLIGWIVIAVIGVIIVAVAVPTKSTPTASKTTKSSAIKPTSKTVIPLSTLNPQAAQILTTATTHYTDQMASIQADAQATNAATYNSAFTTQWRKFQSTDDGTAHTAFNNASNLYFNGNQTAPGAIDNWNSDIEAVSSDIVAWTNDEELVMAAQQTNNPTATDQANVSKDLQTYQADLAKTKADIAQL